MGKTYMMILLLFFVVNYVSAYLDDQVFLIPLGGDVSIDTTAISNAIVGIGLDYDSIHRSDINHIAVHVFGIEANVVGPDANGKLTFVPTQSQPTPGTPPTPACHSGSGPGFFGTIPNLLIGILAIMIFSGRFNTSLLILCVLVVFGYVSSTYVPPIKIIIFIPETHTNVKSITVNANSVPMVSPELPTTGITLHCQVQGSDVPCGSQSCDYTDPNCRIPDAEFVGVLLPLTGSNAITGPIMKEAIIYYLNIDGFTLPYLQFIFCDTQAVPATALQFVTDLYTNHNVTMYIGPLTSDESLTILGQYDKQIILVSPAATASALANKTSFVSMSMSNTDYVLGQNMIIENDFDNTLENVILIYRNDAYGQDIASIVPTYVEAHIYPFPYQTDNSDISTVVANADSSYGQMNNTAILVISYGEVGQILTAARGKSIANHPWYAIGLSYNPSLIDPANVDVSREVQFKTMEYRGSNIEAHTADRTLFYQIFCANYNKTLPSSIALAFDAALLIANTPLIFQTTPYQAYFLLVEQSDVTFGFTGWLSLNSDTGFRASGDFITQLVDDPTLNPLIDDFIELGFVELERHKIRLYEGQTPVDFNYYEVTYRVISNYLIPGNWSSELNCSSTGLEIFARNIRRAFTGYTLNANWPYDISVPLYDTFLVEFNCGTVYITQTCPSALFGSDTQCEIDFQDISGARKRAALNAPASARQVCTNAASTKGCVGGGSPGACPKTNSTCAAAGFKDGCTLSPLICPKKLP